MERWASLGAGSSAPTTGVDGAQPVQSGPGGVDVVHHEAELRLVAPAADEEVPVDVHARIRQPARDPGHPPGLIVDLHEKRLALDELVPAFLQDGAGRGVVGGLEDQVAAVADPAAADGSQVHAACP
jgi:hypothetical protein